MEDQDLKLDLGMLCRCCDHSYRLPELDNFTASQREIIEKLCKLCVDSFKLTAVNG